MFHFNKIFSAIVILQSLCSAYGQPSTISQPDRNLVFDSNKYEQLLVDTRELRDLPRSNISYTLDNSNFQENFNPVFQNGFSVTDNQHPILLTANLQYCILVTIYDPTLKKAAMAHMDINSSINSLSSVLQTMQPGRNLEITISSSYMSSRIADIARWFKNQGHFVTALDIDQSNDLRIQRLPFMETKNGKFEFVFPENYTLSPQTPLEKTIAFDSRTGKFFQLDNDSSVAKCVKEFDLSRFRGLNPQLIGQNYGFSKTTISTLIDACKYCRLDINKTNNNMVPYGFIHDLAPCMTLPVLAPTHNNSIYGTNNTINSYNNHNNNFANHSNHALNSNNSSCYHNNNYYNNTINSYNNYHSNNFANHSNHALNSNNSSYYHNNNYCNNIINGYTLARPL